MNKDNMDFNRHKVSGPLVCPKCKEDNMDQLYPIKPELLYCSVCGTLYRSTNGNILGLGLENTEAAEKLLERSVTDAR